MINVTLRAKAIYELSRAMNVTMLVAEQILADMDKDSNKRCEVA